MKALYKKGDRLLYDGIVGKVDRVNTNSKIISYELTSEEDEELTCTAQEMDCELIDEGVVIDQEKPIADAIFNMSMIARSVDGITDKYYRDGSH